MTSAFVLCLLALVAPILSYQTSSSCPIAAAVSNSSYGALLESIATRTGRTPAEKEPRVKAISGAFERAGLEVQRHTGDVEGVTILGKYVPSQATPNLPIFIVCAHYDVVSNTTGLFDNSAGAAAVAEAALVLAPVFRKEDVKAEIWFIAWDWEENYAGSWSWIKTVSAADKSRMKGVWNMDSIGYISQKPYGQKTPPGMNEAFPQEYAILQKNQFKPNFLAVISDSQSGWLATLMHDTAVKCDIPIEVLTLRLPMPGSIACGPFASNFGDFCRSDHTAFWGVGVDAIHMTDTADLRNPCYHKRCDDWSYMGEENWTFLNQIVSILVQSVYDHATGK